MSSTYRTRVCVRRFLNRPGFHAGAYVLAEVQDTSQWSWERDDSPHLKLEIADCTRRIDLDFDVDSAAELRNSLHKLDVLTAAIARFRAGLVEEAALYRKRERERVRRSREQEEAGASAPAS